MMLGDDGVMTMGDGGSYRVSSTSPSSIWLSPAMPRRKFSHSSHFRRLRSMADGDHAVKIAGKLLALVAHSWTFRSLIAVANITKCFNGTLGMQEELDCFKTIYL
jgi:hypothetical protein